MEYQKGSSKITSSILYRLSNTVFLDSYTMYYIRLCVHVACGYNKNTYYHSFVELAINNSA